ncbi:hypothetical protein MLD38_029307 [Melastoma candidum]|uniref:Uncharacterized protein n=1 Tax=Melastoma candidum TaxID=119954 RepID=A0ACB9N5Z2_9MYRT|nr:hypothetical protein MLD38_029307 [Melastoma candidum]
MKKSGILAVSAAAASFAITSASSSSSSGYTFDSKFKMPQNLETSFGPHKDDSSPWKPMPSDKFAPRYDGLRFIETLVTGQR